MDRSGGGGVGGRGGRGAGLRDRAAGSVGLRGQCATHEWREASDIVLSWKMNLRPLTVNAHGSSQALTPSPSLTQPLLTLLLPNSDPSQCVVVVGGHRVDCT